MSKVVKFFGQKSKIFEKIQGQTVVKIFQKLKKIVKKFNVKSCKNSWKFSKKS